MIVTQEVLDAERERAYYADESVPEKASATFSEGFEAGFDACLAFLRAKGTSVPAEMDHGVVLVPGFVRVELEGER